jgi:hypothetical protein
MKMRPFYIALALIILLFSCRSEIKDDRVIREAERSLEITLDYIKHERELHEFDLNRKIRLANDKINRIKSKIPVDADSKQKITILETEISDLNKKLTILIANTDASTKRITDKWNKYDQSLNAMLKNMQDYLKGIPIDKDTIPLKKDTLR